MQDQSELETDLGRWAGKMVYHGTSSASARDIAAHGISMKKSGLGYFGRGFYTATDEALAKINYADMAAADGNEDDNDESGNKVGVVLSFRIADTARILDLRIPGDWETYNRLSNNGNLISDPSFDVMMRRAGIDGLFDRSFGGVVIYTTQVRSI